MKIRLQSSWDVRQAEDGVIELFSGTQRKNYRTNLKNSALLLFLNKLKYGFRHPEETLLVAKNNNISATLIYSLINKLKEMEMILEDAREDLSILPQNTLYDRQIRFFRSFEREGASGENLNENLQKSSILIAGLGGYGSWIALLAARMGIRNIIGIDFDSVELANLHRQFTFDRQDIGTLKIKACEKKLREADPEINFIGKNLKISHPDDLFDLMAGVDLVFNPFSYLPYQKAFHHPAGIVAQAALLAKKPCLTFGGSWIGPLTLPGKTPCYFCAIKKLELMTNLDPDCRNPCIQKRAFAPPIGACCSLAAFEAARFLSNCDPSQVLNGVIQMDIFDFSRSNFLHIDLNPSCLCLSNALNIQGLS